jgi:hypothetical protein
MHLKTELYYKMISKWAKENTDALFEHRRTLAAAEIGHAFVPKRCFEELLEQIHS